jgi:pimeloyl-ACP methyl ester carboxylesterase
MGADQRMYQGIWRQLDHTSFLDWSAGSSATTIREVAEEVIRTTDLGQGSTLIGSSFGGMVICEIARLRPVKRLILVGSAPNSAEVSGLLRWLHPLIDLAPLALAQALSGKMPTDLSIMFNDADADFIRRMCRAVFVWEGLANSDVPVHRIHGRHDRVIPPPTDAHLIDGGHLIAMTHAAECVRIIETILNTLPSESDE